jgi:IclR family transcriptional regulator, acetate operon repressor
MVAAGDEPAEARSGAQSIERAIAVLAAFSTGAESLALVDVARATGLHASTAYRIVRALVRGRLLEQDALTERYRLGIGAAVLGQTAARHFGLERAESELRDLAMVSGEAVSLGFREGSEVVVLTRAESPQPLRYDRPPGARVGVHVSAMGKALLAFGPDDIAATVRALGPLTRYTPKTITSARRLVTELCASRERGWTLNDEEQNLGVRAVGAPVLDGRGVARLAVAVQGPTVRLVDGDLDRVGRMVQASAERLAAALPIERF